MNEQRKVLLEVSQIIRNPERYDFFENKVPTSPNDTGCILGWVAYVADLESVCEAAEWLDYKGMAGFFDAMRRNVPLWRDIWTKNSKIASKIVRRIALNM